MFNQAKQLKQADAKTLTTPVEKELNKILQKYKDSYNSDYKALLCAINCSQYWRFFIDGCRQHEGWLTFEVTEPGYLLAMMKAFRTMLKCIESKEEDLNHLIQLLHLEATYGVKNLNYDLPTAKELKELPGCYRKANSISCPIAHLVNLDEIIEIVTKGKNLSCQGYKIMPLLRCKFNNIACVCDHYSKKTESLFLAPDDITIELKISDDKKMYTFLKSSPEISNATKEKLLMLKEKNNPIHFLLLSYFILKEENFKPIILPPGQQITIIVESYMQEAITQFDSEMKKANSSELKLGTIFKFIQHCERFHPFIDANTRVFSMLLKNYLLIRHGFPPMLCAENPNTIAADSIDQMILEYINTMQKTFSLAQGIEPPQSQIQNILTELTPNEKKYYATVMEIATECQKSLLPKKILNTHKL